MSAKVCAVSGKLLELEREGEKNPKGLQVERIRPSFGFFWYKKTRRRSSQFFQVVRAGF